MTMAVHQSFGAETLAAVWLTTRRSLRHTRIDLQALRSSSSDPVHTYESSSASRTSFLYSAGSATTLHWAVMLGVKPVKAPPRRTPDIQSRAVLSFLNSCLRCQSNHCYLGPSGDSAKLTCASLKTHSHRHHAQQVRNSINLSIPYHTPGFLADG